MGALSSFLGIGSKRGAYVALAVLTSVWGANWVMMKLALEGADPVVFNVQRTWVAIAVLFAAMAVMRAPLAPQATWTAIVVTGFFQTTVNLGATTVALAGGGAGRTSVLVFTMPFWTLVIARIVLGERVREGMETALVITTLARETGRGDMLAGVLSGVALAGTLAWAWARYGQRVDLRRFFQVTSIFLVLFSIQLVVYAIHEFSEAGVIPVSYTHLTLPTNREV